MNTYCNKCNSGCNGCRPATYGCDFDINANPYDSSIWNVTINGATTRVKIPKINETDTKLSTNYSNASLNYSAEKHEDIIAGSQIGSLINVENLRDVDAVNIDSGDILVYHPYCSDCGVACTPKEARWENYHIPDADGDELEPDSDGNYKILSKTDCGLIEEKLIPTNLLVNSCTVDYIRNSSPDNQGFPWYYGQYNDTINLHLAENAGSWFGVYDLKITVNYGIQTRRSSHTQNYNFRSLVVPVVEGESINEFMKSYILQGFCGRKTDGNTSIPWGEQSLRGSFVFVVPKGKEAYLHHEYRIRSEASYPNYWSTPKDGQMVVGAEVLTEGPLYPASRLNALQIVIEPTVGASVLSPTTDDIRDQLDAPVDIFNNPGS